MPFLCLNERNRALTKAIVFSLEGIDEQLFVPQNKKEKNTMDDQNNMSPNKQPMKKSTAGLLSPTEPDTKCVKCGQPIIAAGQNPSFNDPVDEYPLFCPQCGTWFHRNCTQNKGHYCPSCQKKFSWPIFFCEKCNVGTKVTADSTWPNFRCVTCSEPISLAIIESVGVAEAAILALVGAITIAGFILAIVNDLPLVFKVIAGVFAAPIGLPFIAILLGGILSEAIRGFHNSDAPGTEGMQLQIMAAGDFARQPMAQRLRQVYFFYLKKSIAALLFCVVAIVFIYLWSLSKN